MKVNPEYLYAKYSFPLAIASAVAVPLKLIWAYIFIVPLILLWVLKTGRTFPHVIKNNSWFAVPFMFFVASVAISSVFGLDIWRSFKALPSLLCCSLLVLVVKDLSGKHGSTGILLALLGGQSVAALHSVLAQAFPSHLSTWFLGKVTESGQLALSVLCVAGLAIFLKRTGPDHAKKTGFSNHDAAQILCFVNVALLIAFAYHEHFLADPSGAVLVPSLLGILSGSSLLACLVYWIWATWGPASTPSTKHVALRIVVLDVVVPLLLAALIVNLKRGPWAGVLIGGTILFFIFERRLVLPLLTLALCAFIFLEPVRTRIAQSSQDFFISGGRSIIWEIGAELTTRYPLGVGYKNSPFLQKFSPEIPLELKHFHNNILNILVETGWLSLALFAWWIYALIKGAFVVPASESSRPIALGLGCALISWQVAGLVEYNFGDSEVMLLVFIIMGLLTAIAGRYCGPAETTKCP